MSSSKNLSVEIWGGIECSMNRVGDRYLDQLEFSGHYERLGDFDLIADLGIKKLRYPVLWEKHQPTKDSVIQWDKTEQCLNRLRALQIDPIAGLVHHGSGPTHATIETNQFTGKFAAYAARVARKFPWITYYTPINEPLTTARFCGLYGIWYPHYRDDKSFIQVLLNECKAIVLAMTEIRKINPEALLIQTEDLSKTYSTPTLKYQADFENERRWLAFDLLNGRVDKNHLMWDYITNAGFTETDLSFFWENPCPPDIIGFNYYLTSERYLDERIEEFPAHIIGGNGKHAYADTEAVRVNLEENSGVSILLKEAWNRFKTPLALTEVHLSCTREEQLRWFNDIWQSTNQLRSESIEIKAITAWSLLGSYGWNQLLTNPPGVYESGIFDVRGGKPRPTALARLLKSYTNGEEFKHPVMEGEGWWKKDRRILYFNNQPSSGISSESKSSQPLLIIGKNGTLGKALAKICDIRGIHYQLLCRQQLDISQPQQIERVILQTRPWAIINAAGYVRVDDAEKEAESCFLSNTTGPANLAGICKKFNIKLLTFSSDLVFDGKKVDSYTESDRVGPLNIYGQSKVDAEKLVLEYNPSALVIRTSAFFGPWDHYNFVNNVLATLKSENHFSVANDLYVSPTYVPDLVNSSLDLVLDEEYGIWHLANYGEISWADLALDVAKRAGYNPELLDSIPAEKLGFIAKRPAYSVLNSERGLLLPSLDHALDRFFAEQELIDL